MEIYKLFGPITIALLWLGLIFMIRKWPGDRSMSFSAHAAASKPGIVYYFVLFTVHLSLFFTFVDKWFVPTFHLPYAFVVLTFIAVLGQFLAVCIPSTGGRKTTIHDAVSYVAFLLLVPLSLLIALAPQVSAVGRIVAVVVAAYLAILIVLFVFVKTTKNYFMLFQSTYAASFHLALLVTMYVR